MTWQVNFSRNALHFLKRNHLDDQFIIDCIRLAIRKLSGEDVNVNIKRLGGTWEGFYRIREGKLRVIVEFQFERRRAYIEEIDWRGSAYR